MNWFVEGLQGSGKSTLIEKLSGKYPDHIVFREGDYNPVELAWCAYVSKEKYEGILDTYKELRQEIEEKSYEEGSRRVICYTKIITDVPGFHKDLEQYEIYNNRVSKEDFKRIIFDRYRKWNSDKMILECSLFQNIVEDMILFQNASDQDILGFYEELGKVDWTRSVTVGALTLGGDVVVRKALGKHAGVFASVGGRWVPVAAAIHTNEYENDDFSRTDNIKSTESDGGFTVVPTVGAMWSF